MKPDRIQDKPPHLFSGVRTKMLHFSSDARWLDSFSVEHLARRSLERIIPLKGRFFRGDEEVVLGDEELIVCAFIWYRALGFSRTQAPETLATILIARAAHTGYDPVQR
jgi:hypothetical protein